MEIKKIILIILLMNISYSNAINNLLNWSSLFLVPACLNYLTNKTVDDDDHINLQLLALTAGSYLSAFDQITSTKPQMKPFLINSIKKSLALYMSNYMYELSRTKKIIKKNDKKDHNLKSKFYDFSETVNNFVFSDTFIGHITKYILIFNTLELSISKFLNQF